MGCIFSVITPSFNGASTLHRVYNSLCQQTFRDFEWIIVDDGSTDDTSDMARCYQQNANFPIVYYWQENSHKKTAVNRGVDLASGEFILVADNDDELTDTALETFSYYWQTIPEDSRNFFSGVTGLCVDEYGEMIGDFFPHSRLISTDLEMRLVYGVKGEKWGVKRAEVMRCFPYPENIPGYVPEGLVWSRIDRTYKTLYVNDVVRIYYLERQRAKLKLRGKDARLKCAGRLYAATEALQEHFTIYRKSPCELVKLAINYCRYSFHCGNNLSDTIRGVSSIESRLVVALVLIIGLGVYFKDRVE